MNRIKKVVFIASSGGHLTQLLQLKPMFRDYNSYLITEKDVSTSTLHIDGAEVLYFVPTRKDKILKYIRGNLNTLLLSIRYFLLIKPDVVVSTGAGISVYFCYLAKLFRRKIIFIETYAAIRGKSGAGRIIYPIADRFYVQWENMKQFYPKSIYKGTLY